MLFSLNNVELYIKKNNKKRKEKKLFGKITLVPLWYADIILEGVAPEVYTNTTCFQDLIN